MNFTIDARSEAVSTQLIRWSIEITKLAKCGRNRVIKFERRLPGYVLYIFNTIHIMRR